MEQCQNKKPISYTGGIHFHPTERNENRWLTVKRTMETIEKTGSKVSRNKEVKVSMKFFIKLCRHPSNYEKNHKR